MNANSPSFDSRNPSTANYSDRNSLRNPNRRNVGNERADRYHPSASSRGNSRTSNAKKGSNVSGRQPNNAVSPYAKSFDNSFIDRSSRFVESIRNGLKKAVFGIGSFFGFLWGKSKALATIVVCVIVLGLGFGIDAFATSGKIYQGIYVGDVDVSGMTVKEASHAIADRYEQDLSDTNIYIFADEESANTTDIDMQLMQDEALAEQLSYEEAQENKRLWVANTSTLGVILPAGDLASKAFEYGRSNGFPARINAFINKAILPVEGQYNQTLLDNLIKDIEVVIGSPVVEYGIVIEEGQASITEGHDGYEIDEGSFVSDLNNLFFNDQKGNETYIAQAIYTPLKIDSEKASKTCNAVNEVLKNGASFKYGEEGLEIDPAQLGSWISTSVEKNNEDWYLNPLIDDEKARKNIVESINSEGSEFDINVSIYKDDSNGFMVQPDRAVIIPSIDEALSILDTSLFEQYRQSGKEEPQDTRYNIPINSEERTDAFELNEALTYGIVTGFSTYTTAFNSNANRTYNIQLAADLLDNSCVGANGGRWSFNDIAGECSVESGFREAGAIVSDEYTSAIGGGVCQVATTVFNAVYEAGLPIKERYNHTLYVSSYPNGRDAAVAYPVMDLVWENNTQSDILLTTDHTDGSVTCTLIGVDPQYSVETQTSEWEKGDKFTTKYEEDADLKSGAAYIKTKGVDGSAISVVRIVKDKDGNVIDEKTFVSVYSPVNKVIAYGPGSDMDEIRARFEPKETSDPDSSSSTSPSGSKASNTSNTSNSSNPATPSNSSG